MNCGGLVSCDVRVAGVKGGVDCQPDDTEIRSGAASEAPEVGAYGGNDSLEVDLGQVRSRWEAQAPFEEPLGNCTSSDAAPSEDRLEVHGFKNWARLDVLCLQRQSNILTRRAERFRVDREAREPSSRAPLRRLWHEFNARQIPESLPIKPEVASAGRHPFIENLELVSPLAHKRLHSGCEWRAGEWWKPCCNCGTFHPASHYYKRKDGISPWCRPCCIRNATKNKRKRRKRC